ncbi:MAG: M23 family metallopeptidase, partial [Lachnospiraceae bacterium]|nr:M23 family metallopeptidase [Lachnospiraceae bacterium]
RRKLFEKQQAEKVSEKAAKTAVKKGSKEVSKDLAKEEAKKEVKRFYKRQLFKRAQKEAAKQAAKEGVKVAAVKTTEAAVATGATETAKHTVGIATGTEAVFAAITAVVVIIILLILLIAFILVSIFFYTFYSENISGAMYQSEPEAIEEAELHMTYLEASLAEYIEEIEDKEPGYDGYIIEGSVSIWHNPYTLINYLSAKYLEFDYSDVEGEINDLFNERYTLDKWVEEIEKEVEKEDDDDEETDSESGEETDDEEDEEETETITLNILHVKLTTNDSLENIVSKRMNEEEKDQYEIYEETHGGLQFMSSPIGEDYYPKISSYYGYRYHPISGDLKLHRGLDIAIPEGTYLYAPISGKVTTVAYDDGGYGNYIIVKDDEGNEIRYAHMKTVYLSAGDEVSKGTTVLGESGNTGASTGPHVHVEYLINGDYHNPLFYLDNE